MSTVKVLFILPYVPGPLRPRAEGFVRGLLDRGHEPTVVTPWFDAAERRDVESLRAGGGRVSADGLAARRRVWNRARAVSRAMPTEATLTWIPRLARRVDEAMAREAFDVVHVEHGRAAGYGLHVVSHTRGSGPPVVWDAVDSLGLLSHRARAHWGNLRLGPRLHWDGLFMRRFEEAALRGFRHVTATSPVDAKALRALHGEASPEITVLPNGVDLERFRPGESAARRPDEVVMSGKLGYHANVAMALHFADHVWPRILARRRGAVLRIVGRGAPPAVRRLAERPGIRVVGAVDDLRSHLCRAALAVAPVPYGAGIQNKVIEAMACATPVVASPQAAAALTARDGVELEVEGDDEGFARRCVSLLEDAARREALGRAGRRYVEREHHWPRIVGRLEAVYRAAQSDELAGSSVGAAVG
jgi:glycosyltransferase involved in cell wall biosynthesis